MTSPAVAGATVEVQQPEHTSRMQATSGKRFSEFVGAFQLKCNLANKEDTELFITLAEGTADLCGLPNNNIPSSP